MSLKDKCIILMLCHLASSTVFKETNLFLSNLDGDTEYEPYARYSDGYVYIVGDGDQKDILCDKDDIVVIDKRYEDNPDMTIHNSYKIRDAEKMKEILEILLEYEEENPSEWDRTLDAMIVEWAVHNACYDANIEVHRSYSVDLDNADETLYKKLIKK